MNTVKTTALNQNHKQLGAKMAPFAGYDMPLYYNEGAIKEHEWVREHAGLFDVSHMGQIIISGVRAMELFHTVTPTRFDKAPDGRAKYTVLLNKEGGIIDDMIVTKLHETCFFVVVNAGRKDVDIPYLRDHLPEGCELGILEDRALIALQGQSAERIMKEQLDIDCSDQPYMFFKSIGDDDVDQKIYVSRLGYTGEDGFEISVPADKASAVWDKILGHEDAKPIGLAARDSLRLEMGYPLYGHDIDEKTDPIEASLGWVVGKDNDDYLGADNIRHSRESKPQRKRVGISLSERGIAREGAVIQSEDGKDIGVITSGGHSPVLGHGIGQGYVDTKSAATGQPVKIVVRGRSLEAKIAPLSLIGAKTKSAKII